MSAACLSTAPSALETARAYHAQGELIAAAEAYREALESEPDSRDALLGLSLIARQSQQTLPALRMAEAALAAQPASGTNWAIAWANYGDCLMPYDPGAAEAAFRQAILLACDLAAAHYGLGNIYALREDFAAALECFERAIPSAPGIPEFYFAAAFALGRLGRHAEAGAGYRRAVQLRPAFASAWLNLGVELIADGQDALAELCYRQALHASPGSDPRQKHTRISAHINLGNFKRSRRRFAEAQRHYDDALELTSESHPRLAEVQVAFAYLHLEQEHFADAWRSLELARSASGPVEQIAEIANARGILLLAEHSAQHSKVDGIATLPREAGHEDLVPSAIEAFTEAESLGHKNAASNRGNALLRLGRVAEAIEAHEKALALDPHHVGIRYNLALTQLRAGCFAEGWRNYEARWQFREVHPHPRRFAQPRWQGDALDATSQLFLYAEQGLGDTLQFHRYLLLVMQRFPEAALVLEVQPALLRLLQPLALRLVASNSKRTVQVIAHGDPLPPFTQHCPLMSLPAAFGTTVATVPSPSPLLESDTELAAQHAAELSQLREASVARIGIHWAGNPSYRADRERSTQLATFLPLLPLPYVQWVSLQKGPAALEISVIQSALAEGCCLYDACSQDRDLADTAAWIACLDLIITTDSAMAHLDGCMGKPVWILLPWQSDWRWMQEIETTPWYPTARLFRQCALQGWAELMARVVHEVELFCKKKSGQTEA